MLDRMSGRRLDWMSDRMLDRMLDQILDWMLDRTSDRMLDWISDQMSNRMSVRMLIRWIGCRVRLSDWPELIYIAALWLWQNCDSLTHLIGIVNSRDWSWRVRIIWRGWCCSFGGCCGLGTFLAHSGQFFPCWFGNTQLIQLRTSNSALSMSRAAPTHLC